MSFWASIFLVSAASHFIALSCRPSGNSTSSLLYHSTATSQFDFLNAIPLSFFFSNRNKIRKLKPVYLPLLIILLSGDIHLNPGPSSLTLCTLNIRSLLGPSKSTAILDLAESKHVDIFALTETWITPTTPSELISATPPGFTLISYPRFSLSKKSRSNIIGGGTAFLLREPLVQLPSSTQSFLSFEMSSVTLKLSKSKLTIFNVYRPPPCYSNHRKPAPFSVFLDEFNTLLSLASTIPHNFLITGDFNLHLDDPLNSQVSQFLSALDAANLTQLVNFPTHRDHHTLDLVIAHNRSSICSAIDFSPVSPSDHYPIFSTLTLAPPSPPPQTVISYRCLKSINISKFSQAILHSDLIRHPPSTLSDLVNSYIYTLSSILDSHAPLKTKTVRPRPPKPWFTASLSKLRLARRKLEKIWLRSRSSTDLKLFRSATNSYHDAIITAKKLYNSSLISSNLSNPRKLWSAINKLLNRKSHSVLPTDTPQSSLPQLFANFFSEKVRILHSSIASNSTNPTALVDPPLEPPILSHFSPVTQDEVSKLIGQSSDTFCDLDPIPTSLLKQCLPVLLPTITNIINLSLSSGTFPDQFKICSVLPLLKKYDLDKEEFSNYRPISHLSFISKLVERAVKARLCDHLSANHLFNSFQSAYTKFHSTESTLLAIHDYIIKSMSNQKVTALCLLDLSAAFDTIDHSILIHRLSTWFGLHDLTLSWIKSYLSGRNFHVNINGLISTALPLPHGVPQGSVLGPLLFILYTTPLSSLIADSSINHHFYADDTQLYISFSPLDFCSSILSLQNTISLISDWMSANLLSLNQSKTEFLVIGLPQQLSKLSNPSLSMPSNLSITPSVAARNLGVIFDSTLSMSNHISAISKTCFSSIRDLRRIRNTLDSSTAKTIATSLIHSKVDYCNSLFLNLPKCELDRLQLILNSTARAVSKTPKFSYITPTLKSLHWLKINERISYKILSLTYKCLQFHQPPYLYKLLKVQPCTNTRSSTCITLQRPAVASRLKITNRSFSYQAPVLWNSLPKELRLPNSSSAAPFSPPLALSPAQFHSQLKTFLFNLSFPP